MKPIEEIRRENFASLVAAEPSQAAFARKVRKDKNQVNQWLGRAGSRNISAETAREIEKATGKPNGWMDYEHSGNSQPAAAPASQSVGLDAGKLETSIQFVQQQFESWRKVFVAGDRVALITAVYDELQRTTSPNWIELSRWLADQVTGEEDERQRTVGSTGGHDLGRNQRGAGAAKAASGKP